MGIHKRIKSLLPSSAWIAYILIVFEILYMISPFAMYYYSIYAPPLRFLQSHRQTSFLTVSLLPHFAHHSSRLIGILVYSSWPLITLGSILFCISFLQIYWAKFLHKGTVTSGLYRWVRHPQYTALAIIGFGTTIYWSRFLVYLVYATMLFLYYHLAKHEEQRCLERFGESFRRYMHSTGMFLPRRFEHIAAAALPSLPKNPAYRFPALAGMYVAYIGTVLFAGFAVRDYALSKLNASFSETMSVVSVAPIPRETYERAVDLALSNGLVKKFLSENHSGRLLVYVVPAGWTIPELGLEITHAEEDFIAHPESHGNIPSLNADTLIVLVTEPVLTLPEAQGEEILRHAVSYIPLFEVTMDITTNRILSTIRRNSRGRWNDVSIPLY